LHWRGVLHVPYLRSVVAVTLWDATIASFAFLFLIPLLALTISPAFLLGYVIDTPALLVPVLVGAWPRRELGRALASIPGFWVLRMVNAVFFLRAFMAEVVLGQRLRVYEKGH